MLKIYLARHGQDEDNANNILNGHRDTPLTQIGLQQAAELAKKIKGSGLAFDFILSSPLKRALKTAEIVSETIGGPKPVVVDLLIERSFGRFDGINKDTILEVFVNKVLRTETINYILEPDGGETFPDLVIRANRLIDFLKETYHDGNILLVSHGDFGKMIYAAYYHLNWEEVLKLFHFGNSDLILLSPDSPADQVHVFKIEQKNN